MPAEVWKNQSKVPQFGHGVSPGGCEGSKHIDARQIGQSFGTPSGVRVLIMTSKPPRKGRAGE
jgi:hypothetical protein